MSDDELYPCTRDRLDREARARLNDTRHEPTPYDVLIERTEGATYQRALEAAVDLCRSCPLATAAKCFEDNAEEPWVKAIKGAKNPPRTRPSCGTREGYYAHSRAREATCVACREASRVVWRANDARRRTAVA